MSKVVIAGDASGTGTFTISAPNGNTDRTVVLPDEAGTIITTAGVPASAMPAGSVLQVVQGSTSVQVQTFSTSFIDTGVSLSITPTSASSKILVIVSQQVTQRSNGTGAYYVTAGLKLLRNSTDLFTNNAAAVLRSYVDNGTAAAGGLMSVTYLDSPNTTSSTTYKTQFRTTVGTANVYAQDGNTPSTITLMEIAA